MSQAVEHEVPTIHNVIGKLTNPEYIMNVMLKYLLEATLITFAYITVVHRNIAENRKSTPSADTMTRIFIWVIILFSLMDIMAPQVIPMVRAGIGLCIGTHMAGGISMNKI